jgi:NTE family protein
MSVGLRTLVPAGEPAAEDFSAQERDGFALCLSGGGYRATLFHLGAARRLHEVGALEAVDTISSVSGGSIFAALLAESAIAHGWTEGLEITDFDDQVAEPVRKLTAKDLRTLPFLAHLAWNWAVPGPRARHFQHQLAKNLSQRRIGELPEQPAFVFCATDLTFGVNWESSRARVGSFQAGYLKRGSEWPLARAVAASACFPPVFGPLPVGQPADAFSGGDAPKSERDRLSPRLALSDGGVYDNMGLEPVWKSHERVLVSDGGAPFEFTASHNPVRRLMRYTSVITNQAQAVRRRMFFGDINDAPGRPKRYSGTRWGIRSTVPQPPGYSADLVAERIARVRTDLDRFTSDEQAVLENHGYCVAEAALRRNLPELVANAPEAQPPHEALMDEKRARRALRRSHRRISLVRLIGKG